MKNKFIVGVLCITFSTLHTCYGSENRPVSDGPRRSPCQKLSNAFRVHAAAGVISAASTMLMDPGPSVPMATRAMSVLVGVPLLLLSGYAIKDMINDGFESMRMLHSVTT